MAALRRACTACCARRQDVRTGGPGEHHGTTGASATVVPIVPIAGRLLDVGGKPISGAAVFLQSRGFFPKLQTRRRLLDEPRQHDH